MQAHVIAHHWSQVGQVVPGHEDALWKHRVVASAMPNQLPLTWAVWVSWASPAVLALHGCRVQTHSMAASGQSGQASDYLIS